jgi:ankyrin repeat protein
MRNDAAWSGSKSRAHAGKTTLLQIIPVLILPFMLVLTLVAHSQVLAAAPGQGSSAPSDLQSGDLYALVVGVTRYKDPIIPRLDLADRDAKAFGEFLETQKKLFREIRVTFLLNEKATRSEVEKYLYYSLHKAGKNDTLILFFSGHGAYDPLRPKDFLFLTYDAEPDYLGATAVKMSGLEFLKGIQAERVLIVADACYAGGFSQMKPKGPGPSLKQFLKEARNSSGCAIITSGQEGQLSWEVPKLQNSVFTHNLIEGLKGKADKDHDGVVTLNEAYQYAYNQTREETSGHQHPQFEGKVVGAFPLSYVGPPVPVSELKQRIFPAAKTGDVNKIEELLTFGIDVNTRDEVNDTPLIVAARNGRSDALKLLLEKGADLEARNDSRCTALTCACEKGHTEAARLLATSAANINHKNADGLTPLALAARGGHLELVTLLLSNGADIKYRTNNGKTILSLAAAEGHAEVVKLLLEKGAKVNAQDLERGTPLTEAARNGRAEVAALLLNKGAEIKPKGGTYLDKELILTALRNDAAGAEALLTWGANANAQAESGDTPLTLAAGLGHLKVIKLLINKGAWANLKIRNDMSALALACRTGRTQVVQVLVEGGAHLEAGDKEGNTPLILACQNGHHDVCRLLITKQADVNARNHNGSTALILASENGHLEIERMLLAAGADVAATDSEGNNALIVASGKGHGEIVRILCEKKLDVNAKNNMGRTALMTAARNGHKAVVKLLLARGADVALEDWEGKNALAAASEAGHKEVTDLLSPRGINYTNVQ